MIPIMTKRGSKGNNNNNKSSLFQQQQQQRCGSSVPKKRNIWFIWFRLIIVGIFLGYIMYLYPYPSIKRQNNVTTTTIATTQQQHEDNNNNNNNNNKKNNGSETIISSTTMDHQAMTICTNGIDSFIKEGIRLVAFDFDMTIIRIHTGGRYDGTSFELVQYVRPEFQCFMQQLLLHNITMVITTFSTQKELLSNVLQQILTCPVPPVVVLQCTRDCSEIEESPDCSLPHVNIPVYGGQDMIQDYEEGKQSQLLHAIHYFHLLENNDNMSDKNHIDPYVQKKLETSKESNTNSNEVKLPLDLVHVVLIDDDYDNIRIAEKDGYRTIHYDPTYDDNNPHLFTLLQKNTIR